MGTIALLLIGLTGQSSAGPLDEVKKGLSVGDSVPSIAAIDFREETKTFDQLKGHKGLILMFSRSLNW